ncbi:hypothetical protein UFOVP46_5 [uncultured Caudovirales phage]|uniref:Uncharacterized protein n=1 Tax=uncultured Caudovirales phage TaxID=2100421 RepID=A0A6J5KMA6_9CAUD|nr:hypothetical protein UFOVP46_5 [uncultured Caudovirales phage]
MAIATIGGANAVSPAGTSSVVLQGYSSTGTYTYTPSTPLPAGNYVLTNGTAAESTSVLIGNKTLATTKGSSVSFNLPTATSSLTFKSQTATDLTNTTILRTPMYPNSSGTLNIMGSADGYYYVFDSNNATVWRSPDLFNFSPVIVTISASAYVQANTIRVFKVGSNTVIVGPGQSAVSTDGGNTFARYSMPFTPYSVAYGNNILVAWASTGFFYSSPDGITWTQRTSSSGNTFTVIEYVNNKFVAAGYSKVWSSTDGITWATTGAATGNLLVNSLAYGNGKYVMGINGAATYYSSDLITWTSIATIGAVGAFVGFVNSRFVAMSNASAINYGWTSADGVTWTTSTILMGWQTGNTVSCATVVNGTEYVAMSLNYQQVYRSTNGTTITAAQLATSNGTNLGTMAKYLAVGNAEYLFFTNTNYYKTTDGGNTWTGGYASPTTSQLGLVSVTYTSGTFVAFLTSSTSGGTLYGVTSPDGVTWTVVSQPPYSVAAGGFSDDNYVYAASTTAANATYYRGGISNGSFTFTLSPGTGQHFMANQPSNQVATHPAVVNGVIPAYSTTTVYYVTPLNQSDSASTNLTPKNSSFGAITSTNASGGWRIFYLNGVYVFVDVNGSIWTGTSLQKMSISTSTLAFGANTVQLAASPGVINGALYLAFVGTGTYEVGTLNIMKTTNGTDWSIVSSFSGTTGGTYIIYPYMTNGVSYTFLASNTGIMKINPAPPALFTLYAAGTNVLN